MTPTTSVVAAVIERSGRYLIAQRPEGKGYAGMWEFPGRAPLALLLPRTRARVLAVRFLRLARPQVPYGPAIVAAVA